MQPAPSFFVASGSLPAGVPDDFFARAAHAAKALGAKVVVDTSGPALAAALAEGVFLAKPNLRELQELAGSTLDEREQRLSAGRDLIERGAAEVVALTLGQHGGLLVTRRQAFYAPALPVKPVSAVGAGDSFLGAMIWSLATGQGIENAFRYGMAAGSAALLSAGTDCAGRSGGLRLHPQVRLQPLDIFGTPGDSLIASLTPSVLCSNRPARPAVCGNNDYLCTGGLGRRRRHGIARFDHIAGSRSMMQHQVLVATPLNQSTPQFLGVSSSSYSAHSQRPCSSSPAAASLHLATFSSLLPTETSHHLRDGTSLAAATTVHRLATPIRLFCRSIVNVEAIQ